MKKNEMAERIAKMHEAKRIKAENRISITINNITFRSTDYGWNVYIKSEPELYYTSLTSALKKTYDIKLRKSVANSIATLITKQEDCLKEIITIGEALDEAFKEVKL